jgi:anaerobic ribonucleoside-triphosphate reductase activating protein
MAQDTWGADGGHVASVEELVERWRAAVEAGADGLTVSGGEPLAQPGSLVRLLGAVHHSRAELTAAGGVAAGRDLDILLYTGYEPDELTAAQRAATRLADVVVTGRFEAGRPTDLVWRGSANQQMTPLTELGARRYGPYLDHRPTRPPLQIVDDPSGVLLVGVPRIGDLTRLEKGLRQRRVSLGGTSWRVARRPPSEAG